MSLLVMTGLSEPGLRPSDNVRVVPSNVEASKRCQGRGDQVSAASGAEVVIRVHREAVGAEREIKSYAGESISKSVDHLAPEIRVGKPPVSKHDRRTLATSKVPQPALWQRHLFLNA